MSGLPNGMVVGLVILSAAGVLFLIRVLLGFVREHRHPPRSRKLYLARFDPRQEKCEAKLVRLPLHSSKRRFYESSRDVFPFLAK